MADSLWRLRNRCHGMLARIDAPAAAAIDRARRETAGSQFPEYEMMRVLDEARDAEQAIGTPWPAAVHAILDARGAADRRRIGPPSQEEDTA